MKTVAVIQARMGSTRLPGKVLRDIAGQPILWHIVHRLQKCTTIDEVIIATSDQPGDDPIAEFAEAAEIGVVRGDETDVLGRFQLATQESGADVIVRVNGDAPLVDPEFVDLLVSQLVSNQADFVFLKEGVGCIHDGVDPISRWAFDYIIENAREDRVAVEHVTGYVKANPEAFRIHRIDLPCSYQQCEGRLSVDTPDDLAFMEALHMRMKADAGDINFKTAVALINESPELAELNAHVVQKDIDHNGGVIVVRCDGGGLLGYGHVVRCIAVGRVLRDRFGFGVTFAMRADISDEYCVERVEEAGFPVARFDGECKEDDWLELLVDEKKAVGLIADVRTDLSRASLREIGRQCHVSVIDDGSERRCSADLAFYPPVPQVADLDWSESDTEVLTGWQWVILSEGVVGHGRRSRNAVHDHTTRLSHEVRADGVGLLNGIVMTGGSDPHRLAVPIAKEVAAVLSSMTDEEAEKYRFKFALGPGVADVEEVAKQICDLSGRFEVVRQPDDLPDIMSKSDFAISCFGVTAYELAYFGVPTHLICLDYDHWESAQCFEEAGISERSLLKGVCLPGDFSDRISNFLKDEKRLLDMSDAGRKLVDGGGAIRTAEEITKAIDTRMAEAREAV